MRLYYTVDWWNRLVSVQMGQQIPIRVVLNIPASEYQKVYRGMAQTVYARAVDGRVIRFPVSILQQFLTPSGIHGQFEIYLDERNRLKNIVRCD